MEINKRDKIKLLNSGEYNVSPPTASVLKLNFQFSYTEVEENQTYETESIEYKNIKFYVTIKRSTWPSTYDFKLWATAASNSALRWSFYVYSIKFMVKNVVKVKGCTHQSVQHCNCYENFAIETVNKQFISLNENPLMLCINQLRPSSTIPFNEFYCTVLLNHVCDIIFYPSYSIKDNPETPSVNRNEDQLTNSVIELIFLYTADNDSENDDVVVSGSDTSNDNDSDQDNSDQENNHDGHCKFLVNKQQLCQASAYIEELIKNSDSKSQSNGITLQEMYKKSWISDLLLVLLPPYAQLSLFEWDKLEFFCYFAHKYQCSNMQIRLTDYFLKEFVSWELIGMAEKYGMTRLLCSAVHSMNKDELLTAMGSRVSELWSDDTKWIIFDRLARLQKEEREKAEKMEAKIHEHIL